jgi:hypothetical protein
VNLFFVGGFGCPNVSGDTGKDAVHHNYRTAIILGKITIGIFKMNPDIPDFNNTSRSRAANVEAHLRKNGRRLLKPIDQTGSISSQIELRHTISINTISDRLRTVRK